MQWLQCDLACDDFFFFVCVYFQKKHWFYRKMKSAVTKKYLRTKKKL